MASKLAEQPKKEKPLPDLKGAMTLDAIQAKMTILLSAIPTEERLECSRELALAIYKSGNPAKKMQEVSQAAMKIFAIAEAQDKLHYFDGALSLLMGEKDHVYSGGPLFWSTDEDISDISKLIVKNPDRFVEMVQTFGPDVLVNVGISFLDLCLKDEVAFGRLKDIHSSMKGIQYLEIKFFALFPEDVVRMAQMFRANASQVIGIISRLPDDVLKNSIERIIRALKEYADATGCKPGNGSCDSLVALGILLASQTMDSSGKLSISVSKFENIVRAVIKCTENAGSDPKIFQFISSGEVTELFYNNLDAFVKVSAETGKSTPSAFAALVRVWDLYEKDPVLLLKAFNRLAHRTGPDPNKAFYAITGDIAALFVKKPWEVVNAFTDIASWAGDYAPQAFELLQGKEAAAAFAKNPLAAVRAFKDLSFAAGDSKAKVFSRLGKLKPEQVTAFLSGELSAETVVEILSK